MADSAVDSSVARATPACLTLPASLHQKWFWFLTTCGPRLLPSSYARTASSFHFLNCLTTTLTTQPVVVQISEVADSIDIVDCRVIFCLRVYRDEFIFRQWRPRFFIVGVRVNLIGQL